MLEKYEKDCSSRRREEGKPAVIQQSEDLTSVLKSMRKIVVGEGREGGGKT